MCDGGAAFWSDGLGLLVNLTAVSGISIQSGNTRYIPSLCIISWNMIERIRAAVDLVTDAQASQADSTLNEQLRIRVTRQRMEVLAQASVGK